MEHIYKHFGMNMNLAALNVIAWDVFVFVFGFFENCISDMQQKVWII